MPLPTTSNVDRPQALGYHARLDDLYLRLVANSEIGTPSIESIRPEATRINTAQSPEDFISETGQTFSRARFAGGEGLGFAHREESEPDRFWDSRDVAVGLPPPGERHNTRLLREPESIIDSATSGNRNTPPIATDGSSLWMIADPLTPKVLRSDDPLSSSPTFSNDDPSGNDPSSLAPLGDEIYCATVGGIYKRGTGGAWTQWSDLSADNMWGVKQRILATHGSSHNLLYEARSGADSVLLHTLPPGKEWWGVTDGGSHILAAAGNGYIYAFASDESGDLTLESQTNIPSETPQGITSVGSSVFITTMQKVGSGFYERVAKLWRGALRGDGTIGELQLIRQWGASDLTAWATTLETDGSSVYVGVTATLDSGDHEAELWRYDLAAAGIVRHLPGSIDSTFNLVTGITIIGDRVFFMEENTAVFRESVATYQASGHLITPAADFFTALDKSWSRITLDVDTPTGDDGSNTKVEVYYATDLDAMDDPDSSLWTLAGTIDPDSTDDTFDLADVASRFVVLMVKLHASTDQTATPEIKSVAVTAHVVPEEVSITLPVNVSDQIEPPGRHRHNVRGLGDRIYQELQSRMGKSATLELFRPAETIRGVVWSVSAPVPSVGNTGGRLMVCNVEVRGKKV